MSAPSIGTCVSCRDPLTVYIENDEENEDADMAGAAGSYVADDVQLQCGCHFHWFVYDLLCICLMTY